MNTSRDMKRGGLALVAASLLLALGLQAPARAQAGAEAGEGQGAQAGETRDGRFRHGGFGRRGPGMEPEAGMRGPRMAGGRLLERFDTLDSNDDSLLSQEELLAGPRQRIDRLFGCLDTDADGLLSKEELEGGRELRACMQAFGVDEAR